MNYLHRVDFRVFPAHDFHSHFISFWETGIDSCVVILSRVPPGTGTSIGLHTHQVDQFYLTISGEMTVRLGNKVDRVVPGSLVHIPAGLPHWNWNEGTTDEVHLEIVVPSPMGMANFGRPIPQSSSDLDLAHVAAGTIRKIDIAALTGEGVIKLPIATPESGSAHATIHYCQLTPGSRGRASHTHEFDQFYYVIEGALSAQVGDERHSAGPHSLYVIPAGTAHCQWNDGDRIVRQVTLSVSKSRAGIQEAAA